MAKKEQTVKKEKNNKREKFVNKMLCLINHKESESTEYIISEIYFL